MDANKRQVGGSHYKGDYEHWDFVEDHNLGYLECQALRYICRWRRKDGLRDLEKCQHYVDKLLEMAQRPIPRRPKGSADKASVRRFCAAAGLLAGSETVIVEIISTWVEVDDLKIAQALLETLLEGQRELHIGVDFAKTEHPAPYGYSESEDQTA